METWKPVVGWEDRYEVSDQGRVRRSCRGKSTFIGRIAKASLNSHGYPYVCLLREKRKHTLVVHKLVAIAFLGPYPAKKEVNHKDGDRTNAVLSNLEYVTRSGNNLHAYRVLGRKAAIDSAIKAHSKLKDEQVLEIVQRLKGGETGRALAASFSVDPTQISRIKLGKTWSHLTGITR
jgi:hypothetical protein